jgi:hypothetical protein
MVKTLLLVALTVTLEADASEFLSQVLVCNGVAIEASFDTRSQADAAEFDRGARVPRFATVARGPDSLTDQDPVTIALQVSSDDQTAASTRPSTAAPPPAPNGMGIQSTEAPVPAAGPAAVTFEITHVEASQPQIIRIFNLDEGTREFEITHVETDEPQIVRILNPDEGTREIVLPPAP